MAESYMVPKYTQGMATVDKLNQPLDYIQTALNDISQRVDQISNKSAVIQWQAVLDASVQTGDLVYFDSEGSSACFKPAKAALLGIPGAQGQSVQAPQSRVQGIVLSVDPAVILRSGYYQSSIIQATLGTGAEAGIYYLSPQTAGKATKTPGWNLRQPCLSYYGDGKFSLFSNYLAHDNHHHASLVIGQWQQRAAYDGEYTAQGNYFYKISDADMLGQLSADTTAVFYKGLLNTADFSFQPDAVWCTASEAPQAGQVVVFNDYPFAYGDSVVRTVRSSSLDVKSLNGTYEIDLPQYVKNKVVGSATAVADISGKNISITPVVSRLYAGMGIKVQKLGLGVYQISSAQYDGANIAASDMRMNGTQRVADGLLTYTVFPRSATTSFIISTPVTYSGQNLKGQTKIWFTTRGPGSGRVNISVYWIPVDTSGTEYTTIPGIHIGDTTAVFSNTSTSMLAYTQTDYIGNFDLSTHGTLLAKVQAVAPGSDMYVYQTGFKTTAVAQVQEDDTSDAVSQDILDQLAKVLTYNANY